MPNIPKGQEWIFAVLIVDMVLKGFALWRAAKNNSIYWFIALFVLNSAGIVPLIYLIFFSKTRIIEEQKARLFPHSKKKK